LLTYPLKQDVPHSSDLTLFPNAVAICFYSVVGVPHTAVLFTLKAPEFSTTALQLSQHCCNFQVSTFIPLVFFTVLFFVAEPEGFCTFLQCSCMSQWDRRELYIHFGVTVPSNWP
jgi:hypothetical protein